MLELDSELIELIELDEIELDEIELDEIELDEIELTEDELERASSIILRVIQNEWHSQFNPKYSKV